MALLVFRNRVDKNRARIALNIEAVTQMPRKTSIARQFLNSSGFKKERSKGNIKKDVNTNDTLYPAISLPHMISHDEIVVVSNRSNVCRSRSLVMLPAVKTGAAKILKTST